MTRALFDIYIGTEPAVGSACKAAWEKMTELMHRDPRPQRRDVATSTASLEEIAARFV